jgi:hypothetical protein
MIRPGQRMQHAGEEPAVLMREDAGVGESHGRREGKAGGNKAAERLCHRERPG